MKFRLILVLTATAALLAGCADKSLLTDDEYYRMKDPAPYSPDPMQNIPVAPERPPGY